MTSLEEGDIFSYEYADGQFIITKVSMLIAIKEKRSLIMM